MFSGMTTNLGHNIVVIKNKNWGKQRGLGLDDFPIWPYKDWFFLLLEDFLNEILPLSISPPPGTNKS